MNHFQSETFQINFLIYNLLKQCQDIRDAFLKNAWFIKISYLKLK